MNTSYHRFQQNKINESKTNEGYMDPVSPTRMQKKVDEVNSLIAQAVDSDNDPLGVIDNTGTWQAPMKFQPFKYVNGFLYSEYSEYTGRSKDEIKKERYKPSDSFDAYEWLNQVAKWYRSAIRKDLRDRNNPPIQENATTKDNYSRQDVINMLEDTYKNVSEILNDYGKKSDEYQNEAEEFVKNYMKDK